MVYLSGESDHEMKKSAAPDEGKEKSVRMIDNVEGLYQSHLAE